MGSLQLCGAGRLRAGVLGRVVLVGCEVHSQANISRSL